MDASPPPAVALANTSTTTAVTAAATAGGPMGVVSPSLLLPAQAPPEQLTGRCNAVDAATAHTVTTVTVGMPESAPVQASGGPLHAAGIEMKEPGEVGGDASAAAAAGSGSVTVALGGGGEQAASGVADTHIPRPQSIAKVICSMMAGTRCCVFVAASPQAYTRGILIC
jgi:hypothetical protein